MNLEELQRQNLEILVRNGGFQFSDTFFPYTSGQIGPYHVNSAAVMNSGWDYVLAVTAISKLVLQVGHSPFIISGGETKDWVFSLPCASSLSLPHVMLYKDGRVLGAELKGRNVVHVADLNNEGTSIKDYWLPIIEREGGLIKGVVFYVDRLEDGTKVMQELGLKCSSVVPLNESAWEYLRAREVVNDEVYRNLIERMKGKDAWARDMLRSDKGLERLEVLLRDPKKCEKALKVLRVGYPELKDELVDRLGSRLRVGVKL